MSIVTAEDFIWCLAAKGATHDRFSLDVHTIQLLRKFLSEAAVKSQ